MNNMNMLRGPDQCQLRSRSSQEATRNHMQDLFSCNLLGLVEALHERIAASDCPPSRLNVRPETVDTDSAWCSEEGERNYS